MLFISFAVLIFIDRHRYPDLRASKEPLAAYATPMKALDPGRCCTRRGKVQGGARVDTTFHVGYQVMLRTKELLEADGAELRARWEGPSRRNGTISQRSLQISFQVISQENR